MEAHAASRNATFLGDARVPPAEFLLFRVLSGMQLWVASTHKWHQLGAHRDRHSTSFSPVKRSFYAWLLSSAMWGCSRVPGTYSNLSQAAQCGSLDLLPGKMWRHPNAQFSVPNAAVETEHRNGTKRSRNNTFGSTAHPHGLVVVMGLAREEEHGSGAK